MTKLAGKQAVKVLDEFVLIILDIYSLNGLKYKNIFSDHYTSKLRTDHAAKNIDEIADSDFRGNN